MVIYEVGGAVRDRLLGLPVQDRDWVVVGATPQEMEALGFKAVGRDFPVFLHPETHEEYALARTERKVALGYHGFQFQASTDVTLEQDLQRRDLTINAIAADASGALIDPYGGQADLAARVLRHVSPAFAEDPVRILRVARFAARFGFSVAESTMELMRGMVAAGEVDALVPERVWQEFSKGLLEAHPTLFFRVLHDAGALEVCLPGCAALAAADSEGALGLQYAARLKLGLPTRIAILALSTAAAPVLAERLRWPTALQDLARLCAQSGAALRRLDWHSGNAEAMLQLIESADALRRPQRLEEALSGMACLQPEGGRKAMASVLAGLHAARAIDAGAVAAQAAEPAAIPALVRAARLAALQAELRLREG